MSRIGKLPISVPNGVTIDIVGSKVKVTGPKGTLERSFGKEVEITLTDGVITITRKKENDQARAMHGTTRAHIANMVKGVSDGWTKTLELIGTGYRADVTGNMLTLSVGYSNPVKMPIPEGLTGKVEKSILTMEGSDKELLSWFCDRVRFVRPPEPYKGKGIKYTDEIVRRKAGKAAKSAA